MRRPKDYTDQAAPTNRPFATWGLMALAAIIVLLLPDGTGSGNLRPVWVFLIPILLGLAGAALALKRGHLWWAVGSALWGFVLLQALIVATTLISGP